MNCISLCVPQRFSRRTTADRARKNSGLWIAINHCFESQADPGDEVDIPVISIPESSGFFVSGWSPGKTERKSNKISFFDKLFRVTT